jgi:hypothetical protein
LCDRGFCKEPNKSSKNGNLATATPRGGRMTLGIKHSRNSSLGLRSAVPPASTSAAGPRRYCRRRNGVIEGRTEMRHVLPQIVVDPLPQKRTYSPVAGLY